MTEDIKRLVEAASKVRAAYDGFLFCNDGFMGNQADAYQRLYKAARPAWDELAQALAPFTTKETDHG